MNPMVSFVVPCYNLAHLLGECVESILGQTYRDFEVLIMDDCSPDNTLEIAQSFTDSRIRYIRNEPNLGHLRNYNKGIGLARGKYVWLISADDRLRTTLILDRYVDLMERNPNVGYVFCPAISLVNGTESRVLHSHGPSDRVFKGKNFLIHLLDGNSVVAASGMARKDCYDKVAYFPLDMPWGGDWYLWCLFALHYEVGYFAEPMVNYRSHDLSMTTFLTENAPDLCKKDDYVIYWRVKEKAQALRCRRVVAKCRHMISYQGARTFRRNSAEDADSLVAWKASVRSFASNRAEERLVIAGLHACLGDQQYLVRDFLRASEEYRRALKLFPADWKTIAKLTLARLGSGGVTFRETVTRICFPKSARSVPSPIKTPSKGREVCR